MNYNEFLHSKVQVHPACGFEMPKEQMNPMMFEWQKDIQTDSFLINTQ